MKRTRLFFAILTVLLALTLPSAGLAKRFTYTSGFQVQNLSASQNAAVIIDYYNNQKAAVNGGQKATTATDTIQPSKSNTYFPIHPTGSFDGSVVISSSQPVASIVNLLGSSGTTFKGGGSYIGTSTGANSIQLPLLMKGNAHGAIDTWFSVQNVGGSKTTVNVAYSDGTNAASVAVDPGATVMFDQQTETHPVTVFAATVSSDGSIAGTTAQPLAAVAVEETDAGMVFAYTGFIKGSVDPLFPLVNVQPTRNIWSGIAIRNTDPTADTVVTVTYTPSDTTLPPCTETQPITHQSVATFGFVFAPGYVLPTGGSTTCTVNARMVGSGAVTANTGGTGGVNLVAVVNQVAGGTKGSAYSSFNRADATNIVVFPLVMDRNAGLSTALTVMNLGAPTTVTCTYADVSSTFNDSQPLSTNQSMVVSHQNKFTTLTRYVGSAVCTAANPTDQIVGILNELSPSAGDTLFTYEGINSK